MIIFLDFDGVVHPVSFPLKDPFSALPLFETWLRQHPEVDVVVSSAWRKERTLDDLKGFFSPDLQCRIIGKTPHLKGDLNMRGQRETEVLQWLSDAGRRGDAWVALDDDEQAYVSNHRLVSTYSDGVLTVEHLTKLDVHMMRAKSGGSGHSST